MMPVDENGHTKSGVELSDAIVRRNLRVAEEGVLRRGRRAAARVAGRMEERGMKLESRRSIRPVQEKERYIKERKFEAQGNKDSESWGESPHEILKL